MEGRSLPSHLKEEFENDLQQAYFNLLKAQHPVDAGRVPLIAHVEQDENVIPHLEERARVILDSAYEKNSLAFSGAYLKRLWNAYRGSFDDILSVIGVEHYLPEAENRLRWFPWREGIVRRWNPSLPLGGPAIMHDYIASTLRQDLAALKEMREAVKAAARERRTYAGMKLH